VVRELMFGPRRFSELRAGLPGISANVLTQRLEGLEAEGIVIKREQPSTAYELTPWGYEAEPIFQVLGRWAARSPTHDPTLPLSAASFLLSLRTMFVADRAKNLQACVGIVLHQETYVAAVERQLLTIRREPLRDVQVTLSGTPEALAAAVYGGQSLSSLIIDGDRALAKRFATLFTLPPKAKPAA